jgi:hypothetical protein
LLIVAEMRILVLESPLSSTRSLLACTGFAWVAELAEPRTYRHLYERVGGLAESTAEVFLGLLINASLVAEVGKDGSLAEDSNPALLQWSFTTCCSIPEVESARTITRSAVPFAFSARSRHSRWSSRE